MANTNSLELSLASAQNAQYFGSGVNLTGDITIEAWVKPLSTSSNNQVICARDNLGDGGTANRSWAFMYDSSLSVRFGFSTSGSDMEFYPSGINLSIGTWAHLAVSRVASSGVVSFYLNGSLFLTTTQHTGSLQQTNTTSFRVGARGSQGNVDNLGGRIDEIRYWSLIRSASDILTNYQRELAGNESGLVLYAKLDNDYSDSSPNGFSLSPSGVPTFSTDVPFADTTTTSTSTTSTSTSTTSTSSSTSTSTTSTSSSTSTTSSTSTSTTSTSTTSTHTSTSTTTTSTSTTSTSSSTTTTSTSTSTTTSTSTSTTITIDLRLIVEKVK